MCWTLTLNVTSTRAWRSWHYIDNTFYRLETPRRQYLSTTAIYNSELSRWIPYTLRDSVAYVLEKFMNYLDTFTYRTLWNTKLRHEHCLWCSQTNDIVVYTCVHSKQVIPCVLLSTWKLSGVQYNYHHFG